MLFLALMLHHACAIHDPMNRSSVVPRAGCRDSEECCQDSLRYPRKAWKQSKAYTNKVKQIQPVRWSLLHRPCLFWARTLFSSESDKRVVLVSSGTQLNEQSLVFHPTITWPMTSFSSRPLCTEYRPLYLLRTDWCYYYSHYHHYS